MKVEELRKAFKISDRAFKTVLKEYKIQSKRKNRYTLNENYFDEIDTERKAYILGLIYADGFVGDEKYNNIVISINDKELLEDIKKEIDFTGEIRKTKKGGFKNSKEGYSLNFSSLKIASSLRDKGLYPNKSLTLDKMPELKEDLKRHFLRGYFDGDGSISISRNSSIAKGKRYTYYQLLFTIIGTKPMLENIISTFDINSFNISQSKTPEMFYLKVKSKREINNIYNLMYIGATIYLKRKYEIWFNSLGATT